jgi:hypothetical protein
VSALREPELRWRRGAGGEALLVGAYAHGRRRYSLFEGRGKLVYPDGTWDWVDDDFRPNVLVDEGEASVINVYLREQANVSKYLMLISGAAPAETAVMSGLTESETPGTDGYNRQQIAAGDWGAPALDTGDMQSSAAEKTFGPNTGAAWTIAHVAGVTVATGTAGLFLFYITTTVTSVGTSVAYKFTTRWKNQ